MPDPRPLILFGSGTIGALIARQLTSAGTPPLAFADNDDKKWGSQLEGVRILSPSVALSTFPSAKWVATVHRTPARPEILAQIAAMKVEQVSLYDFLPARTDLPPEEANATLEYLMADKESLLFFFDQIFFRKNPTTYIQLPPSDIKNVYFESFFTHLDDEHFVDCGAADGDTIRDFTSRWEKWRRITAFEPDRENFKRLRQSTTTLNTQLIEAALWDSPCQMNFHATADQGAHLGDGEYAVECVKLDHFFQQNSWLPPPTLIKMDVEGAEMESLWGARDIIRTHSPVLAICAYHKGDDLWQIPLLIHTINPTYKLYFRRYLEATWELIWYAVPPSRVQ